MATRDWQDDSKTSIFCESGPSQNGRTEITAALLSGDRRTREQYFQNEKDQIDKSRQP